YNEISGPVLGSNQPSGVYAVCYQRTELSTNLKDTCCFRINFTVQCKSKLTGCPKDTTIYLLPSDTGTVCRGSAYVTLKMPGDSGIIYKQVSGVPNGSFLPVGSYPICYASAKAIHDSVPRFTDTCCFTVNVVCQPRTITSPATTGQPMKLLVAPPDLDKLH